MNQLSCEPDETCLSCPSISDDQVVPRTHLGVDKRICADRTIYNVRLGQAAALLEFLEVITSLRDESNGD